MQIKNNSLAKKSRNIGNEHFRKQEYYDALLQYNHSLCHAPIGSESISIAYANRSAVYIKLKQFDLCLENIQQARDSNYPTEKIERLNKREEECKELMKTQKPNPDDDPFNYFKLSYPPNPKYPQIVDCLELHNNKTLGIITTRDLKTGDIIAIEDPVCIFVNESDRQNSCNFCIKDNRMNLIPCSGCTMAMFCSQKCQQKAMSGFHQFICNNDQNYDDKTASLLIRMVKCLAAFDYNVKEIKNFLTTNKSKNLFDFDMSNPDDPMYEKNIIWLLSLTKYRGKHFDKMGPITCGIFADFAKRIPKLNQLWKTNRNFLNSFLPNQAFNRSTVFLENYSNIQHQPPAVSSIRNENELITQYPRTRSYLFSGMLNHSCDPNVQCVLVSNKNVYYVCKPIKAGSQISYAIASFSHEGPKATRQKYVKLITGIACNCPACESDWPFIQGLRSIDPTFQYDDMNSLSPHDQAKKTIARNNAYVDKNYKENDPTQEVYITIENNFFELCAISRPSFYP